MMDTNNPDLIRGLNSVFECRHFDWTKYGVNSYQLQSDVLGVFSSFNPDIVFMHLQSADVIHSGTAQMMAQNSIVLNWTGDVRYPLPQHYLDLGKHIHATLFTNENDVDASRNHGVKSGFLQVGFDSTHFSPLGDIDSKYPEIVFLGSNYTDTFPLSSYRYEMVMRLKNEFGNRFGVYGGGWNGMENGNITSYAEEGKLYRSSKIAINLSHFNYRRYSSDRMYRILGSGTFCLSRNYEEIEKDFKVGHDLAVWNDINELVSKIRFYLNNDAERERIALNGCFNARTKWTWHHFAQNLKAVAEKHGLKKTTKQK